MNTVYFVRHGETDWNAQNRFQGIVDIPLDDKGRGQVSKTAQELKDITFDVVYCSPLSRAKETCEIILKSNKHGGKINFDKRIIERSFGDWDGLTVTDIYDASNPKYHWWMQNNEMPLPNGESIADIEKRVGGFLEYLKKAHNNKKILVVCHGGVMLAVHFLLNPKPTDGDLYAAHKIDNACVEVYSI
jgi:broad specificity phosphatase PhoE